MEKTATQIVKKLQEAGFKAVFAGGCVRDSLLALTPKDYDVATSATPDQVEALFDKTLAIGKSFGVIVVLENGYSIEVATFRTDGNYSDGRRPDSVKFSTMEEDAKRRDFKINGMFFDPISGICHDYVGGRQDLENRVIKFIGNPYDRIADDKLRMLRAIRFAVKYDFTISETSFDAIKQQADQIYQVSPERIFEELTKMFILDNPGKALDLLYESGLLQQILPEVAVLKGVEQGKKYHPEGSVFIHSKLVMFFVKNDPILRWSALLHDIGKKTTFRIRQGRPTFYGHEEAGSIAANKIILRFKASNEFRATVVCLVRNHMKFFNITNMKKATLKRLFREPFYLSLQELHKADLLGSCGELLTYNYACTKYNELSNELEQKLLISGYDLIALGLKPNPEFKKILRNVETLQLEGKLTSKEEALEYVQNNLKS